MTNVMTSPMAGRRIFFVIGLVADQEANKDGVDSENLRLVLARMRSLMPSTPIAVISSLRNHREIELTRTASECGAEIWQLRSTVIEVATLSDVPVVQKIVHASTTVSSGDAADLVTLVGHCHLTVCFASGVAGVAHRTHDYRIHSIPASLGGSRGVFFAAETGASLMVDGASKLSSGPIDSMITLPAGRESRAWNDQLYELDRLNREIADFKGKISYRSAAEVPVSEVSPAVAETFQIVDTLSRRHQRNVTLMHSYTLAMGLFAILSLQWMGGAFKNMPMADWYAVVFMVLGTGHIWVRNHSISDRYADYRVLAEGLRVQHAWHLGGIDKAPSEFFLHKHHARLAWVRDALKTFHLYTPRSSGKATDCTKWVKHQAQYHNESAIRNGWLRNFFENCVRGFYGVSGVITAWMFYWGHTSAWSGVASATLGITASCGTLLLIFNANMGFGTRAALHGRMHESFAVAAEFLQNQHQPHEHDELLIDLGLEVIQETGEWIFVQGPP